MNIPTPLGNTNDLFKSASGIVQMANRNGLIKKGLQFLGRSPGLNMMEYESASATKTPNAAYYARRYALTWGNIGAVVGFLGSSILGKVASMQETPNPMVKMIQGLLGLGGLVGLVGSTWAHVTGATFKKDVGEKESLVKAGAEIFKDVKVELENDKLVAKLNNSPLRFNDVITKKIQGAQPEDPKGIKQFFTGISGTGKTEGIDFLAGRIIKFEAERPLQDGESRKVVKVVRLKGKALNEAINLSHKNSSDRNELLSNFLSLSGIDPTNAQEVQDALKKSKTQLLEGFLLGLEREFVSAKGRNERLVVELDEMDELFSVAREGGPNGKYDEEFLGNISGVLANLLDSDNGYDILCTSNRTVKDLCGIGLGGNYQAVEDIRGTNMEKVYDRLRQMSQEVGPPDEDTKGKIFHVRLNEFIADGRISDESYDFNGSKITIADLKSMSEQEASTVLMSAFNDKFGLTNIPDVTDEKGLLAFRGLMSSGKITNFEQLEELKQRVMLKLKFKQLSGRDIVNIFAQDLNNSYNAYGQKVSINSLLDAIYTKVVGSGVDAGDGCELTRAQLKSIQDLFKPLEDAYQAAHLKLVEDIPVRGGDLAKRQKAQRNISLLMTNSPSFKALVERSKTMSEEEYERVASHEKCEQIFNELKRFNDTYNNDVSPYLQSLDLAELNADDVKEDKRVSSIGMQAAMILGMLNNAARAKTTV